MRRTRSPDLSPVLDLLAAADAARDPAALRLGAVDVLARLLPCDHVVWGELDVTRMRPGAVAASGGATAHLDVAAFARHAAEHPLIRHHLATGDPAPLRLSDFLDRRRLHALGLYADFYRPLGTEHVLCMALPASGGLVGIAYHRGRRDFGEHERGVLARVRPALALVVRHAAAPAAPPPGGAVDGLTSREAQVLRLVAAGRTNGEVGATLGISARTVEKHLEHVYVKLGVSGRFAAAAVCARSDDPRR